MADGVILGLGFIARGRRRFSYGLAGVACDWVSGRLCNWKAFRMIWLRLALLTIGGLLLNAAFLFRAPEYAVASGVVFAIAIGLETTHV